MFSLLFLADNGDNVVGKSKLSMKFLFFYFCEIQSHIAKIKDQKYRNFREIREIKKPARSPSACSFRLNLKCFSEQLIMIRWRLLCSSKVKFQIRSWGNGGNSHLGF